MHVNWRERREKFMGFHHLDRCLVDACLFGKRVLFMLSTLCTVHTDILFSGTPTKLFAKNVRSIHLFNLTSPHHGPQISQNSRHSIPAPIVIFAFTALAADVTADLPSATCSICLVSACFDASPDLGYRNPHNRQPLHDTQREVLLVRL